MSATVVTGVVEGVTAGLSVVVVCGETCFGGVGSCREVDEIRARI